MGTGGVGGYFGARLAQGGCDVGFVARGTNLAAIREHGLQVESPLGGIYLPKVRISDDPVALGPADFIFVTVKLWDTEAAVHAIAPVVGSETTVISFQNGVQKDEVLRRILGEKCVVGGIAYINSRIARPGVISHIGKMQKLVFGEYDGSRSQRAVALHEACVKSSIDAEISTDICRAIWEKFVFLVGLSATTTAIRSTLGPIVHNSQTRAFLLDIMREVVAVGRASNVNLSEDFAENRLAFCDGLPSDMDSSMHADLNNSNRLELDWLSGAIVELGKGVNVLTPMNRAVRDILTLYKQGKKVSREGTA
jgi:2-dehydropantoate 2-reductase